MANILCGPLHLNVYYYTTCCLLNEEYLYNKLFIDHSQHLLYDASTVESHLLEPPRETKICSRNREFKILGVKLQ